MKELPINQIICGDALEVLKTLPDESVDCIITDPPYGTTPADWDKDFDLTTFWQEINRVARPTTPIVVFGQQPFTSKLIMSNLGNYKYNWVWEKDNGTNFLNSHYQPLKVTEDICVFGQLGASWNRKGNLTYNPQFGSGKPYKISSGNQKSNSAVVRGGTGGRESVGGFETVSDGRRYPKNLIKFNRDKERLHPTQKPLGLMEYLINTYSKEGDLILDPFIGSGTTAVACKKLGISYIGIEINPEYVKMAEKRLSQIPERLI